MDKVELRRLYLHHFRSYTKAEFTFGPDINWITGKNGLGKTNLLEAIYLLSCGRSYRTHQLKELIQQGASFFYLEAEIEKDGVLQTLKLTLDKERKVFEHDGSTHSHFSPLISLIPHVLYTPEDMELAHGAPASRRKLLNMHLSHLDPLYLHHLVRYHKAMRHRNELLRQHREEAIQPWEEMMAHSAHYLVDKRREMVETLQPLFRDMAQQLSSHEEEIDIAYECSLSLTQVQEFKDHWKAQRPKELQGAATLHGPHRDDLSLTLNSLSVKSFASEGQKHSVVAALRLALWHDLKNRGNGVPLMSIDDFGSHLDRNRQKNFKEQLSVVGQTFLTSPEVIPGIFPAEKIVEIKAGMTS